MLLTVLLSLSMAHADIAIPPPDGEQFVRHDLEVVGLEAHPDVVLIAIDEGSTVHGYRAFRPGGEARQTLAQGGRNRSGGVSAPSVKMLPKARTICRYMLYGPRYLTLTARNIRITFPCSWRI